MSIWRTVERLAEAEQRKKKLVIQYAGEGKAITLNDIYYMESQNHNIVLFLKTGKLEYYGKIGDLEEELAEQFLQWLLYITYIA